MNMQLKQISSLEKICSINDLSCKEIKRAKVLGGEKFSYQIVINAPSGIQQNAISVEVKSPLKEYIQVYSVKNMPADFPVYSLVEDDDYITKTPSLIPDLLVPISQQNNYISLQSDLSTLWVEVSVPKDYDAGKFPICICLTQRKNVTNDIVYQVCPHMELEILPMNIPEQKTIYTQWLHVDCIALAHDVPVYSEEHWDLIEKYIALAVEVGINMILTPVLTPPLDTAVGSSRLNTQLVKIEKKNEEYVFDFSLLRRWIAICKKHNVKYYEISHLFAQWGAEYTPNIYVEIDGKTEHLFGWHVKANDPEYKKFLTAFIPQLLEIFEDEKIKDVCRFHISDEPNKDHLENYRYAHDLIKPLLNDCILTDALSDVEFYQHGLVTNPICASSFIEPFIENKIDATWVYYCCGQHTDVSNRFLAMPSYRNRIIGLQMYKFGIPGFAQWGYNFYLSQLSFYEINPYTSTSSGGAFPSGDAFSVYPGKNGPLPSLRALVFQEAMQDIEVCRLLEQQIGKEAVVALIEEEAGMEITFKQLSLIHI